MTNTVKIAFYLSTFSLEPVKVFINRLQWANFLLFCVGFFGVLPAYTCKIRLEQNKISSISLDHENFNRLVMGLSVTTAQKTKTPPNIIFILADDLGYGDLGYNGQPYIKTPNIDRLAREGMVFTQHYSGSTVCGPSRCALLTGKHMGHATVRGNPRWTSTGSPVDMKASDVTVAEELKRAGYQTAIIGKWGMSEENNDTSMPYNQGFDYFFGYRKHTDAHFYYFDTLWQNKSPFILPGNNVEKKEGQYTHDLFVEKALQYVREQKDNPFFLYLAFTIPHYELTVPEESKRPYLNQGWKERPMKDSHYHHDAEGNTTYAGMVSRMDGDIGRLVEQLNELGIAENTLLVFTSDNGQEYDKDLFFNSNGPFSGAKRDMQEGGIHAPMVAWWPGTIQAGSKSDHVSAFWDFLPTACQIAGVKPSDKQIDGISYLPSLLGKGRQKKHPWLYWEFNESKGPMQAIRYRNWKYIKNYQTPIQLYNLETDVDESDNLATTYPKIVAKCEKMLAKSRTEDPAWILEKRNQNKN